VTLSLFLSLQDFKIINLKFSRKIAISSGYNSARKQIKNNRNPQRSIEIGQNREKCRTREKFQELVFA
jgi:hypothetical protein